jgi:23S rRNA pseudouridine1911/1915/1917 synthase
VNTEEQLDEESELYEHHRVTADPGQSLLRIDKFLMDRLPNTSRSKLQAAAENGNIKVNGKNVKSSYRVKPGDEITVVLPYPVREIELIPQDIPLDIVYEDDSLIILNKPSGIVVHPGYGNYSGTLVNGLVYHFKDLPLNKNSEIPRPGLVHRLDKNTTGLMVIAKTEQALTHLSKQFFDRTIERRYNAIAWGDILEDGTIIGNVGRSIHNRKVMNVFDDPEMGKHAVTHYKVLERFGYVTLIECKLETGRTHQIRVHMSHIKHPLFNDNEYGGDKILKGTSFGKYKQFIANCFELLPRQALHAKTLGLTHPTTGKWMQFDSNLPSDILAVIEKWKNYTINRDLYNE